MTGEDNKSLAELWKDVVYQVSEDSVTVQAKSTTSKAKNQNINLRLSYEVKVKDKLINLTYRERQVLILLTECLTNQEMAQRLNVSVRTIEYFVRNLRQKFKCKTKGDLIRLVHGTDFINKIHVAGIYT